MGDEAQPKKTAAGSGLLGKSAIVIALVVVVVFVVILKGRNSATGETSKTGGGTASGLESGQSTAQDQLPRLVDLGAGKCIPCKMMAPILEELETEFEGQLEVVFIDVWENKDAGKPYGIKVIPTQIFYDASGVEFFRHEGFFSKEDILNKFKERGIDLEL